MSHADCGSPTRADPRELTSDSGERVAYPGPDALLHSQAPEEPELSSEPRLLARFAKAISECGLVGESALAQLVYLVITSRLLDKPVSLGVKGLSSSGKSFVVETTLGFFPPRAVLAMTAMSQKALIYTKEDLRHRTLVLYEVEALREGNDEDQTAYFVRSLLSEGRIDYHVTVRSPEKGEGFVTRKITKEGPTGLIFTTTKAQIHRDNETRVISATSDDSTEQTARILVSMAAGISESVDLTVWLQLQEWLECAERRVVIPYAVTLAKLVQPTAVRLRRDFKAVLGLIQAHAILHQRTRERDAEGRIVATWDDYEQVRRLVAPLISEGVRMAVSLATRETVDAVIELAPTNPDGVMGTVLAAKLKLDPSAARRRLEVAERGGWVVNQEDRSRRPGRWAVGEQLPTREQILPPAERVQAAAKASAFNEAPDLISIDPSEGTKAFGSDRSSDSASSVSVLDEVVV